MKKLLAGFVFALATGVAFAQSSIIRGESAAGTYENLSSVSQRLAVNSGTVDPCASPLIAKSSVVIAITTATTTSLVAPSGTTTIYVCGFTLTISQVVTTANIITFTTGTGATCGTGTVNRTGGFGTGGITAAAPIVVRAGYGQVLFSSAASDRLCAVTTIGASAAFTGVLTYVQQ